MKLSIAEANRRLETLSKTSTFADVERLLGKANRLIEVHGNIPAHAFELDDGEVRVGSYDRAKLRYIRVFERPAGLPEDAVLDDTAAGYRRTSNNAQEYFDMTGVLLRRVTSRRGASDIIEEVGPGGTLVVSIEPLCTAIQRKRKGEVVKLVAAGPVIGTFQGKSALHHLAESMPDAVIAKQMIDAGVAVDLRDDDDRTPLYTAIEQRRAKSPLVEFLLEMGADIDARCGKTRQDTVLHLACETKTGVMNAREEELALWLIERGADPT
ncbi:MAG: ankyrin repeat domain-containing protein, partial [Deltaproteobacteria bacterium]|nr:ankyrin repeat domain-containing protein [Deltaproteobacteria bacterium]